MRQNRVRRARNFPVRSELKSLVKKIYQLIKEANLDEAKKLMPLAYAIIDKAAKKNILHPNNAARKKSRIARTLNEAEKDGGKKAEAPAKKKAAPKKAAAKKEEKVEESAE